MRQISEFVAVLACSLFTGAAVYISLVEHPSRMECGVEIAATEFPFSYRRASVMQDYFRSRTCSRPVSGLTNTMPKIASNRQPKYFTTCS